MRPMLVLGLVAALHVGGCAAAPPTADASVPSDACPRTDTCLDVCGDGVCTVAPCCRTETCATCPGDCCAETGPHG